MDWIVCECDWGHSMPNVECLNLLICKWISNLNIFSTGWWNTGRHTCFTCLTRCWCSIHKANNKWMVNGECRLVMMLPLDCMNKFSWTKETDRAIDKDFIQISSLNNKYVWKKYYEFKRDTNKKTPQIESKNVDCDVTLNCTTFKHLAIVVYVHEFSLLYWWRWYVHYSLPSLRLFLQLLTVAVRCISFVIYHSHTIHKRLTMKRYNVSNRFHKFYFFLFFFVFFPSSLSSLFHCI